MPFDMKSALLALVALATVGVACGSSAQGTHDPFVIGQSGTWTVVGSNTRDGVHRCGMVTSWRNGINLTIRVFSLDEDHALSIRIAKKTWNIPAGTRISLAFSLGSINKNWLGAGNGSNIDIPLPIKQSRDFWASLRQNERMTIRFLEGNEPPINTASVGGNAAVDMMSDCIGRWPGSAPTQPFAAAPSQPFASHDAPARHRNEDPAAQNGRSRPPPSTVPAEPTLPGQDGHGLPPGSEVL